MEDRAARYRGLLTIFLLIITAAGAVIWLLRRPEPRPLEIIAPPPRAKAGERVVKVYVSGEVLNSGVYTLGEGDRVEDALRAAGGLTDEADRTRVNLAARVQDQQQIIVPPLARPGVSLVPQPEAERARTPSAPGGKVNLNTASAEELDTLPGIGLVTAQKILKYREQVGSLKSAEELRDAKIVTNAQFERIQALVTAP